MAAHRAANASKQGNETVTVRIQTHSDVLRHHSMHSDVLRYIQTHSDAHLPCCPLRDRLQQPYRESNEVRSYAWVSAWWLHRGWHCVPWVSHNVTWLCHVMVTYTVTWQCHVTVSHHCVTQCHLSVCHCFCQQLVTYHY